MTDTQPDPASAPANPRRIRSDVVHNALIEAGVIRADDFIHRMIIDLKAGDIVRIYTERYGDSRILDVVPTIGAESVHAEIVESPAPATPPLKVAVLGASLDDASQTAADLGMSGSQVRTASVGQGVGALRGISRDWTILITRRAAKMLEDGATETTDGARENLRVLGASGNLIWTQR